jgi:hypothetical protein
MQFKWQFMTPQVKAFRHTMGRFGNRCYGNGEFNKVDPSGD